MQLRCRNCNRPYAMKREEVHAALDIVHTEALKYYNSHCPHCGKTNKVTVKELHRGAPGWSPAQTETSESSA